MKDNKNPFKENQQNNIQEETKETENIEEKVENNTEENIENAQEVEETKDDYKEKYEELNNKYIRLAADFDNYRKRTQSEKEALSSYTQAEVLSKLTSVLDTFDRADESLKTVEDAKTIKEGYEVAIKQFVDTLKKLGLEEIEALGKEFNPNEHEAIAQVENNEFKPNCVAYVAQKGYKMGERIIRPALVGVAKEKEND